MDVADMGFFQLIAVVIIGLATEAIALWIDDDRANVAKRK